MTLMTGTGSAPENLLLLALIIRSHGLLAPSIRSHGRPAVDEVLASLQHIKREKARGESVWRVFWGLSRRHEWSGGRLATEH
jgi:hypothetical protein